MRECGSGPASISSPDKRAIANRHKHLDEDGLVELAHRKLNLSRATWIIEYILLGSHVSVKTTQLPSGRRVDRGVDFRTRAEIEPAVLAAISEFVAELRQSSLD